MSSKSQFNYDMNIFIIRHRWVFRTRWWLRATLLSDLCQHPRILPLLLPLRLQTSFRPAHMFVWVYVGDFVKLYLSKCDAPFKPNMTPALVRSENHSFHWLELQNNVVSLHLVKHTRCNALWQIITQLTDRRKPSRLRRQNEDEVEYVFLDSLKRMTQLCGDPSSPHKDTMWECSSLLLCVATWPDTLKVRFFSHCQGSS